MFFKCYNVIIYFRQVRARGTHAAAPPPPFCDALVRTFSNQNTKNYFDSNIIIYSNILYVLLISSTDRTQQKN